MKLRTRLVAVIVSLAMIYGGLLVFLAAQLVPGTALFGELALISAKARLRLSYQQQLRTQPTGTLNDVIQATLLPPGVTVGPAPPTPATVKAQLQLQPGWEVQLNAPIPQGMMALPRRSLPRGPLRFLLLALFTIAAGQLLSRQLRRSLARFPEALARITAGDLQHRIAPDPDPDLQDVIAEFNLLADRLRSAQQDLQDQLRQQALQRDSKSKLLGLVSHELRTPLTTLLAQAEELEAEPRRQLQDSCAGFLLRLDRLLEWARLDGGQLEPCWQEFELSEVLETALEAALIPNLQVDLWPQPILIRSDFAWLARALESLLAAAGEGNLTALCTTTVEANWACLSLPPGRRVSREHVKIPPRLTAVECRQVLKALGARLEEGAQIRIWLPL